MNRELQQRGDVLAVDNGFYMGSLLLLPSFYYGHQFIPPAATARIARISHFKSLIFAPISSEQLIIERPKLLMKGFHCENIYYDDKDGIVFLFYRLKIKSQ